MYSGVLQSNNDFSDALIKNLSSETFSGSYEGKLNVAPGIYMLRLVNGNDVKVQKMVVR